MESEQSHFKENKMHAICLNSKQKDFGMSTNFHNIVKFKANHVQSYEIQHQLYKTDLL